MGRVIGLTFEEKENESKKEKSENKAPKKEKSEKE